MADILSLLLLTERTHLESYNRRPIHPKKIIAVPSQEPSRFSVIFSDVLTSQNRCICLCVVYDVVTYMDTGAHTLTSRTVTPLFLLGLAVSHPPRTEDRDGVTSSGLRLAMGDMSQPLTASGCDVVLAGWPT